MEANRLWESFVEYQRLHRDDVEQQETAELVVAARMGNLPRLRVLLREENRGNYSQSLVNRALLRTLSHGFPEAVIEAAAQALFLAGQTPKVDCTLAKESLAEQIVELLIETGGADVNAVESSHTVCLGSTALHYACHRELDWTTQFLCSCDGIDPSLREGHYNYTALSVAVKTGREKPVRLLLEAGADAQGLFDLDDNKGTYLHVAAKLGNTGVVSALLDHGASVEASAGPLPSPIHFAKSGQVVNLLITRGGASVHDQQNAEGNTPLFSVKSDSAALALIEAGADIHHVNEAGHNALLTACEKGKYKKVRVLVEKGASLFDPMAEESLVVAAKNKRFNIVRFLLTSRGATRH